MHSTDRKTDKSPDKQSKTSPDKPSKTSPDKPSPAKQASPVKQPTPTKQSPSKKSKTEVRKNLVTLRYYYQNMVICYQNALMIDVEQ